MLQRHVLFQTGTEAYQQKHIRTVWRETYASNECCFSRYILEFLTRHRVTYFSSSCCWLWLLNFDSERKEKMLSASLTGCNFTVGEFSCQLVVILYFWRLQFFNEEMSGYHREVLGEERGKGFIVFFFSPFLSCLQIYIGEKKKKNGQNGSWGHNSNSVVNLL